MIKYTHLEDYINRLYQSMCIDTPSALDLHAIAFKLQIEIYLWEEAAQAVSYGQRKIIMLDSRTSPQQQWQDFGHELCHILQHAGNQQSMPPPFREYQEWQATNFSYHFCVPTFMLRKIPNLNIYSIMSQFNVGFELASKRLSMFQNKILGVVYNEKDKRVTI